METVKRIFFLLIAIVFFASCSDDQPVLPGTDKVPVPPAGTAALYVLNEGLFNMNNCTLTHCDFEKKQLDHDFFYTVNRRNLGDTGNDMKQYGSKIYCVINVSSQVEVIDAKSGKSVAQIPIFNGDIPRQPRCITFWENKAYVASFDGTVTRIDTATLCVEAHTSVGRNPDGICAVNGKLYVSNSGGLDAPKYDSTVSVVSIATFTEVKKITVGTNPFTLAADSYGDVYVATRGNYGSQNYNLHRISSSTDELMQTLNIEAFNFAINGDYAYICHHSFTQDSSWVKMFNVKTEQVERSNFITDGTALHSPFGVTVDERNGYVYITDTKDSYITNGEALCFSPEGVLQFRLKTGLNPHSVVTIRK